jgi:membrane-associated phospholipid phosphatase
MSRNCSAATSYRSADQKSRQKASHAVWLWLVLLGGLAFSFAVDAPTVRALSDVQDSALADLVGCTVRWVGTGYVQALAIILMIAAGVLFHRGVAGAGARGLLAFAISGAMATAIKLLVHRSRPWTEVPTGETWLGYVRLSMENGDLRSFPSGESTTTFAVAVVLGWSFPRLRVPLLIVAVAVALGRILVGSHYPSDVYAGALLGVAVAQWVARPGGRGAREGSPSESQKRARCDAT